MRSCTHKTPPPRMSLTGSARWKPNISHFTLSRSYVSNNCSSTSGIASSLPAGMSVLDRSTHNLCSRYSCYSLKARGNLHIMTKASLLILRHNFRFHRRYAKLTSSMTKGLPCAFWSSFRRHSSFSLGKRGGSWCLFLPGKCGRANFDIFYCEGEPGGAKKKWKTKKPERRTTVLKRTKRRGLKA